MKLRTIVLAGIAGAVLATGCAPRKPLMLESSIQRLNENYERRITHYNEVKSLIEDATLKFFGQEGLDKIREYKAEVLSGREFEKRFQRDDGLVLTGALVESRKTAYIKAGPAYNVLGTAAHEAAGHEITTQDKNSAISDIDDILAIIPKINGKESHKELAEKIIQRAAMISKIEEIRKTLYTRENLETRLMEEAGAFAIERMYVNYWAEEYKINAKQPDETHHHSLHAVASCIIYDLGDRLSHKNPNQDPYKTLKQVWEVINTSNYMEIEDWLKPSTKEMAEKYFQENVKK